MLWVFSITFIDKYSGGKYIGLELVKTFTCMNHIQHMKDWKATMVVEVPFL